MIGDEVLSPSFGHIVQLCQNIIAETPQNDSIFDNMWQTIIVFILVLRIIKSYCRKGSCKACTKTFMFSPIKYNYLTFLCLSFFTAHLHSLSGCKIEPPSFSHFRIRRICKMLLNIQKIVVWNFTLRKLHYKYQIG